MIFVGVSFLLIGLAIVFGIIKDNTSIVVNPENFPEYVAYYLGTTTGRAFGMMWSIFSLIILGGFSLAAFQPGSYDQIDKQGITIKRLWKKYFFLFSDIQYIRKLNAEEAGNIVFQDLISTDSIVDIPQNLKRHLNLIGFATVPFQEIRKGARRRYQGKLVAVRTVGNFVLFSTHSGQQYLLTPANVDVFVALARENGVLIQ